MTTLNDVFASHVNATGQLFSGPSRIGGYQIKPGGTAGQILFYNGTSAAGELLMEVDVTTNVAIISTLIPGSGIRFSNGCYVSLPAGTSITVFRG